jgi:hypothetical protein
MYISEGMGIMNIGRVAWSFISNGNLLHHTGVPLLGPLSASSCP